MIFNGMPMAIETCVDIIKQYIYEKTGKNVNINYYIAPKHEEKFIKALNIACNHYGIVI
jgi:hypothetical protein